MAFNSLVFIFIFLPVLLLIYRFLPRQAQNVFLLLASFLFYAWGSPEALVLILLSTGFNYFSAVGIGKRLEEGNKGGAKLHLAIAVVFDVAVLAVYKYTGLGMPLGISFYSFSVMSGLFDVYYGRAPVRVNPFEFLLYIMFFPKVISGPIVQWKDFQEQVKNHPLTRDGFLEGFNLFLIGLFKKVLLADKLGTTFASVFALPDQTVGMAWIGMLGYGLQLYMDFSGYSDMAIGLAKMFGFSFNKNFDYPYTSSNISEFWRRWHISLGAWFRDYVYIPLGGNRCSRSRHLINLLVVWSLTGIWHGSTLNYLFWGLWHGLLVILDKNVIGKPLERTPRVFRMLLTDLAVFVGWVFFFTQGVGNAFAYMGRLFGLGAAGFWNSATTFCLTENLILFVVSFLCCGPFVFNLHEKLTYRRRGPGMAVSIVLYAVLFVFCIANILGSTWTTFMYAAF
ncbi:MAG: MBOAT family protein [Lachnospiraceae bacterium]|nr:MBOAT family protein [Lachnospiraceae bacterium]